MGAAFEVLSGRVTNPGATLTAWTMDTGDSAAIRSAPLDSKAELCNAWALGATAGVLRVRSPRLHDSTQNLRLGVAAADPRALLPYQFDQRLYPQDVLTIEQSGGGAETDCGSLLVSYDNLPGVNARLFKWGEIAPRINNWTAVETSHSTGATLGDYGGSVAINSSFDLLKANVDYAVLGYVTSVAVATVGYRSPDFGNLRVGGPGTTQRDETRQWFTWLDQQHDQPFIPVFNAANKGSTFVDLVHTAAATAVVVQTILAELRTA